MTQKNPPCFVETMTKEMWPEVSRIYEAGIATKQATFEKQAPVWETWDNAHRQDCRLVAHLNKKDCRLGRFVQCLQSVRLRWGGRGKYLHRCRLPG